MRQHKIAVIIINYNGLNDTIQCLNSVLKSTVMVYPIVIDNGSKNNEAFLLKKIFPNVHILRSEQNGGFSAGNNIGIKFALKNNFDYICLLNNDTEIDKHCIERLVNNIKEDTMVVPLIKYYSRPDLVWYAGGSILKNKGNAIHLNMDKSSSINHDYYCSFATGCCWLAPKNFYSEVGLLSEEYFMYCEDLDYSIRIEQNRKKIFFVHDAVVYHKVSASSGGNYSPFSTFYLTRNRLYLLRKYKDYFSWYSFLYTIVSRFMRFFEFLFKGRKASIYIIYGINDFILKRMGKSKRFDK